MTAVLARIQKGLHLRNGRCNPCRRDEPSFAAASIPWPGDKGEQAAVVKSTLQLNKAFIRRCDYTDGYVHIVSVNFDRHSILDVVLEMAHKR
jgi:hypothetical protein